MRPILYSDRESTERLNC